MTKYNVKTTCHLPEHDWLLNLILDYFFEIKGIIGCFLSGSTATGSMDSDSDLDLGLLFRSDEEREAVWSERWDWDIAPWFHRFDADHIKAYFVIYFFEPNIKADFNLYSQNDLPSQEGSPYEIVWDQVGALGSWIESLREVKGIKPNWNQVVHEDERFWAWTSYCYSHVHRGEYYHVAYEYPVLRDILERWTALVAGYPYFNSRRLEGELFAVNLLTYHLFPKPELLSLKNALLDAIQYQLVLRKEIAVLFEAERKDFNWKTSAYAVDKITSLVEGL